MNGMDKRSNNNASHLRKQPGERKRAITIYETVDDVQALGGIEAVRAALKAAFELLKQDAVDKHVILGK